MIKAVIFDCFSVLIGDATKLAANELWLADHEKGEQFRAITHAVDRGIISETEAVDTHASLLGMSPEVLRELRNKGEVRNVELLEYIESSLKGQYKLAVMSNISSRPRLDLRFLPGELDRIFDVVVASGDVGYIKPQPEIYQIVAEKLGVEPEECVLIDDIADFCDGARAIGMQAIQFTSNTQALTELSALIDRSEKRV